MENSNILPFSTNPWEHNISRARVAAVFFFLCAVLCCSPPAIADDAGSADGGKAVWRDPSGLTYTLGKTSAQLNISTTITVNAGYTATATYTLYKKDQNNQWVPDQTWNKLNIPAGADQVVSASPFTVALNQTYHIGVKVTYSGGGGKIDFVRDITVPAK